IDRNIPERVIGDSHRLRQILLNLLGNAFKFTESGEIFLSVTKNGSLHTEKAINILFQVKDTGIGIPLEKQSRLFSAFSQIDASTTRKYGGTGLGLAISHKLVSIMGGELSVSSEAEKGSTFSFSLPTKILDNGVSDIGNNPDTNKNSHFYDRKVLIIDDNKTTLQV